MASHGETFSDETFDMLCSMCTNQGRNTEAAKFCIDCNDHFCFKCVKIHNRVPCCVTHKVVDIELVVSGCGDEKQLMLTERCNKHEDKYINMYCQDHDNIGCSKCIDEEHSSCMNTFYIPKFLKKKDHRVNPKEIRRRLATTIKALTKQANRYQNDKENLFKKKTELLDNIDTFRQEINDTLDKLQQNSVDEIEETFSTLYKKIEETMRKIVENKTKITTANDKLKSPNINEADVFVNIKVGEDLVGNATKCIEENEENYRTEDFDYKIDRKILATITEVNAFGNIIKDTTQTSDSSSKSDDTNAEADGKPVAKVNPFQRVLDKNARIRITGVCTYFVKKHWSDSNAEAVNVTSCCYMDDGKPIISDWTNKKVKRLNRYSYSVKDSLELSGKTWQVCPINDQEVAVTVPSKQKIYIISVVKSPGITKKIKTEFECRGIAYTDDSLYISDKSSLYIYKMSEKKMEPFDVADDGLFSDIYCISINKDASRIYVADYENGLIILDNNGEVIKTVNRPQLNGVNNCFVTATGNVLVTAGLTNNLVQFTPDGEIMGEILKFKKESSMIRAVSCNKKMTLMSISTEYTNKMYIYCID